MDFSKSKCLFEGAKTFIPGGVNSPVRAFRAVGGNLFLLKAQRALTCMTKMEINSSI